MKNKVETKPVHGKQVWFRPILERVGPGLEGFTVLLSVLSVVLILLAQFPPTGLFDVPRQIAGMNTVHFVQSGIWAVFLFVFLIYGLTHRKLQSYARKFWLELVVCLSWAPFMVIPLLAHLPELVPLTLIGTMAHILRSARWVVKRFERNPFVVLGSFVFVLVIFASVLLMKIEPETFSSFQESVFFVYMTALTLGGKFQANTLAGEIVVMIVATAGIGVVAVVIGVVREVLQRKIFGDHDMQLNMLHQLEQNNLLIKRMLTRQEELETKVATLEAEKAAASGTQE